MEKETVKQICDYAFKEKYNIFLIETKFYNNLFITKDINYVNNLYKVDYKLLKNELELNSFLIDKYISGINYEDKKIPIESFIYNYNKENSENQKLMLKNISNYIGYGWTDNIIYLLSKTTKNYKEAVSVINSFSISTLHLSSIEFDKMDDLLESFSPKKEDIDTFWFKFFKARKNQSKNPLYGHKMTSFLIKKYGRDENKLRPFFEFSNHIKSQFEEIDFKLEEEGARYVTAYRINCRKVAQALCIEDCTEAGIEGVIKTFTEGLTNFLNLESFKVVEYERKILEVRLYGNEKQYSQEEIVKLTKDFLLHKKSNPELKTTVESVNSWLMKKSLSEKLASDSNKTYKRNKI